MIEKIDKSIAASTLLSYGLYWSMNRLAPMDLHPMDKQSLSWAMPAAVLANELWRQHLVSGLEAAKTEHRFLRGLAHPATLLAAHAISWITGQSVWKWPTACATFCLLANHASQEQSALKWINTLGQGGLMVDTLQLSELVDRKAWTEFQNPKEEPPPSSADVLEGYLKTADLPSDAGLNQNIDSLNQMWQEIVKNYEEEIADAKSYRNYIHRLFQDATEKDKMNREENRNKIKEENEELLKFKEEMKKADERYDKVMKDILKFLFEFQNRWGLKAEGTPQNCAPLMHSAFKNLSDVARAAHENFDPRCTEHAKAILSNQFNEEAFSKNPCGYTLQLLKAMNLATHPDKNPRNAAMAQKAFISIRLAAETLCPS